MNIRSLSELPVLLQGIFPSAKEDFWELEWRTLPVGLKSLWFRRDLALIKPAFVSMTLF